MNRGRLGHRQQVAEEEWGAEGQAEGLEERPAEGPEEGGQDGPAEGPAGVATAGAEYPQSAGHVGEDNMDAKEDMEETAGDGTGLGRSRLQSPPLPWEDYTLCEISRETTDLSLIHI